MDRGTTITINRPFEVPGTALPPGTYVFRIMDLPGNRNVVQVLNADETHSYAIVLGVPAWTLDPKDDTDIAFYETQPESPVPVRHWFYSGYNSGVEFVYPKAKALAIARESGEPVPAAPWEPEYVPAPGELETAPVVEITPSGEEMELAAVVPTAEPEPVLPGTEPAELPRTASPVPLLALTGLFAAAAAGAVRLVRRSRV
jgi:hypothetical protein